MEKDFFLRKLVHEIQPAMGCTEPAMSALAGAKASELLKCHEIAVLKIHASRDMIKNAMGVAIPGCSLKGISAAVALGAAVADTSDSLSILSSVDRSAIEKAVSFKTELLLDEGVPSLYVRVDAETSDGHSASVAIEGEHDAFSKIVLDGSVLLDKRPSAATEASEESFDDVSIADIISFAESVPIDQISFIEKAIDANMRIAEFAISNGAGLHVGKIMSEDLKKAPASLNEAFMLASCYASAGSDARMSGCSMPVYINSGSGNQGITVTVPIKVLGTYLGSSEEKIIRAVCISELVGLMLTEKKSRLSALCGAFTAAMGTACGYIYLLDGDADLMDKAVNTMVGDLMGIICDGAKVTCALKIYSCLEAASLAVKLALSGKAPGEESGIVGSDACDSINHLSRICNEGMRETDHAIYSIMVDKANRVS